MFFLNHWFCVFYNAKFFWALLGFGDIFPCFAVLPQRRKGFTLGTGQRKVRKAGVFFGFYLSRKETKALNFLLLLLLLSVFPNGYFENYCPSPDRNENPFAFFFKKQKIVVDSGK